MLISLGEEHEKHITGEINVASNIAETPALDSISFVVVACSVQATQW